MTQTVEQALSGGRFTSDGITYRLIQLPARGITPAASIVAEISDPFCSLIVDKDEISLIIPMEFVAEFDERLNRLPGYTLSHFNYRLITLDVELEPELVGLLARVSTALAEAGISLLALAAFSRDHFLVAEADFENAMNALQRLTT